MVGDSDGLVEVSDSTFRRNRAADGGAIHIARTGVNGVTTIDGVFEDNIAYEQGWGSRGSALRFKYIAGRVNVDGDYVNNTAAEGRSLIANNNIDGTGYVTLGGKFINNDCAEGGSVWDSHMKFNGTFVVKAGTIFENNDSVKNPGTVVLLRGIEGQTTTNYISAEKVNDLPTDYIIDS
eukprot:CFRG7307T1